MTACGVLVWLAEMLLIGAIVLAVVVPLNDVGMKLSRTSASGNGAISSLFHITSLGRACAEISKNGRGDIFILSYSFLKPNKIIVIHLSSKAG